MDNLPITDVTAKKWYLSKTLWFGVLTFISGGIMAIQNVYPNLGYLAMLSGIIQIILRFFTTQPVR